MMQENDISYSAMPILLIHRKDPELAVAILNELAIAPMRGEVIIDVDHKYANRKIAEYQITESLILAGKPRDEIQEFFLKNAKYEPFLVLSEVERRQFIDKLYLETVNRLCSNPTRSRIIQAYRTVKNSPFPGRTGGTDSQVVLAMLSKAFEFKTYIVTISHAEIQKHTHLSKATVSKCCKRLAAKGLLIKRSSLKTPTLGSQYNIGKYVDNALKANNSSLLGYCSPFVHKEESWLTSPLWKQWNLGLSAKLVYESLLTEGLSINELSVRTGKHRNTITKSLTRLRKHGLAKRVNNKWIKGESSLMGVAIRKGCPGIAQKSEKDYYENLGAFQKLWCKCDKDGQQDPIHSLESRKPHDLNQLGVAG